VTFEDEGTYTVSLTVTDGEGNTDRASVRVVVKPGVAREPLQALILTPTSSPITVQKDRVITFKGVGEGGVPFRINGAAEDEPYGYFWDMPGIQTEDTGGNFRDVDVTFDQTGVFTLTFTVKDSRGVVESASIQVTVI